MKLELIKDVSFDASYKSVTKYMVILDGEVKLISNDLYEAKQAYDNVRASVSMKSRVTVLMREEL